MSCWQWHPQTEVRDARDAGLTAFSACQVDDTCVGGGAVSEVELTRAKNATISSVLMNLESRVVVTEDIGRQILTYGHRYVWWEGGGGQKERGSGKWGLREDREVGVQKTAL